MGIYQLTNVPTDASGLGIACFVDGENLNIVCVEKVTPGFSRPAGSSLITSTFVGDHMLAKPEALRKMYGDDICTAIRLARDIGYNQALRAVRQVLRIPG